MKKKLNTYENEKECKKKRNRIRRRRHEGEETRHEILEARKVGLGIESKRNDKLENRHQTKRKCKNHTKKDNKKHENRKKIKN